MANPANLAGTMPGEAVNGIYGIVPDLIARPGVLRVGIVIFDVDTVKRKVATGAETPVIQLRHIEVAEGDDAEAVAAYLRNLHRARIGDEQLELPYTPGSIAPPPSPKNTPADDDD